MQVWHCVLGKPEENTYQGSFPTRQGCPLADADVAFDFVIGMGVFEASSHLDGGAGLTSRL